MLPVVLEVYKLHNQGQDTRYVDTPGGYHHEPYGPEWIKVTLREVDTKDWIQLSLNLRVAKYQAGNFQLGTRVEILFGGRPKKPKPMRKMALE